MVLPSGFWVEPFFARQRLADEGHVGRVPGVAIIEPAAEK